LERKAGRPRKHRKKVKGGKSEDRSKKGKDLKKGSFHSNKEQGKHMRQTVNDNQDEGK
jgi:hypothetical protein